MSANSKRFADLETTKVELSHKVVELTDALDKVTKVATLARRYIRKIKRTTNQYEEGRELCIEADKRITQGLKKAGVK